MAKEKKEEKVVGLKATIEKLNKDFGKGTVMNLNAKVSGTYDVIPTGSVKYDYQVLGVGGFVKGKLYEIRGWEGSGKSTVCGHAAAACQAGGGTVAYIDGEHAVDKNYFAKLGVNVDNMLFSQPEFGEQGFEIAKLLIESGEVTLVIIDSDNALLPESVMKGEMGASNIGKKAKLNSQSYPILKMAAARNKCCVIVISQYRSNIGVMYGDPKVTQGGNALKFWADCIIDMTKTGKKDGDDIIVSNTTKLRTLKNKTAPPFREAKVDIVFGKGFDNIEELMDLAKEYEILKIWGKKTTHIASGEVFETEGFAQMLEDNPEYFKKLREEIINLLKGGAPVPTFVPTAEDLEVIEAANTLPDE